MYTHARTTPRCCLNTYIHICERGVTYPDMQMEWGVLHIEPLTNKTTPFFPRTERMDTPFFVWGGSLFSRFLYALVGSRFFFSFFLFLFFIIIKNIVNKWMNE